MSELLNSGGRVGVSHILSALEAEHIEYNYMFRIKVWKWSINKLEEEIKYIEELISMGKDIVGNNFATSNHINTLNRCKVALKKLKPINNDINS